MTRLIEIRPISDPASIEISIWLTDICNYDCSYCFPGSKDNIYRYQKDVDLLVNRFNNLLSFYKEKHNKTKFFISICGGGEPTLYPNFIEFCSGIKSQHDVYFRIITNGSRTLRWWEENSKYLNEVMISCHGEFTDPKHVTSVADYLTERSILTNVLVMMDANNWDKCVHNIEYMQTNSKHDWIIEAKPIYSSETHDVNFYTKEQTEFVSQSLKRIGSSTLLKNLDKLNPYKSIALYDDGTVNPHRINEYLQNSQNSFYKWNCEVLNSELLITVDGKVHARCEKIPVDLNILSDDFSSKLELFEPKRVRCPELVCGVTNNHHFAKVRP